MQNHRRRLLIPAVIAAVLLVPAIIWSGMQQGDATTPKGMTKIVDVKTVGPVMTPYVMTAQEKAKTAMPVWTAPDPMDNTRTVEPKSTIGSKGPYPGMTQAELDKLAEWRASPAPVNPAIPTPQKEPKSTIVTVTRPPGIDGLTPQERAKLEAYLKNQNR